MSWWLFYWIVCGIVTFGVGSRSGTSFGDFVFSMLVGGFMVPAWAITRLLR